MLSSLAAIGVDSVRCELARNPFCFSHANDLWRGAMAGALKKKLGLTITSEKTEGAARTYHIAD